MLAFLVGELSNAAKNFCTFANLKHDEANDSQKIFGEAAGNCFKEEKIKLKILGVHLQSIHFRNLLSYTLRISDFDLQDLRKMKHEAFYLFKCCCLFDSKILPSLWTLCDIVPFHADKCLNMYKMGLGFNTMEGREQKHQMISKYAENSTYQNTWPMIFRHEYIQLIYLREKG